MTAITEYFKNIKHSATSIFEGMAVTMSWMFREPMTTQYPYHPRDARKVERLKQQLRETSDPARRHELQTEMRQYTKGGPETLPERYRGFLEVQMDICTACQACERACPIECIVIDIEKVEKEPGKKARAMTRFDIDLAKCMYCGLCVEPCPTGAIRHTQHFEGSVENLDNLVARFVQADAVEPFKPIKGVDPDILEKGEWAKRALPAFDDCWAPGPDFSVIADVVEEKPKGPVMPKLSDRAKQAIGADLNKLADILTATMAGTDCYACGYPTCREYSEALVGGIKSGNRIDPHLCEPGGKDTHIEVDQILLGFDEKRLPTDADLARFAGLPAPGAEGAPAAPAAPAPAAGGTPAG